LNRKIIQKIIAELDKPDARLDYVRGILETLLDSLPEEKKPESVDISPILYGFGATGTPLSPNPVVMNEAQKMEQEAKAKLKSVEGIINKSVSME